MAIQLSKNGNAVRFDFDDNSHYLNDGTIEVPVNSLTLVTDESNMFTFKKAASDDIFISGLYSEIGMSKSELIAWYKDNMVGSTGGGGVTSGEVQTMIDESISGKAESSAVTEEISEAVSGKADSSAVTQSINAAVSGKADTSDVQTLSGDVQTLSGDVTNKADTTAVTASINAAVSGKMDTSAFNTYSASTDARLSEDEEVTSAALNELNDALDDKADTSAVTASIAAAVSGKQDTLIAGSGITIDSANTISCTVEGGGKAIVAGRGISVTTGATADTVSFDLPISAGTFSNSSLIIGESTNICNATRAIATGFQTKAQQTNAFAQGYKTDAGQEQSHAEGYETKAYGTNSHSEGRSTSAMTPGSHAEGFYTITSNFYEHTQGQYNVTSKNSNTFGDSGNTLFSVGNGTANDARHNAFEIRQNGDIYITSGGTDIKLQDNLGGGGKAISAGTNISVTTGETADTVSCTLPIRVTSNNANSIYIGNGNGNAYNNNCIVVGESVNANFKNCICVGATLTAGAANSQVFGDRNSSQNECEHITGRLNISNKANTTFGNSGNTLFSVGNGYVKYPIDGHHNAFEIRQNGDIYIADTNDTTYQNYYEKPMIKLQDALGGGGVPESAFTAYTAATEARLAEDEEVTAASLNALNDAIDDKADASDLGGLKLVQLTQAQYDALTTKDASTLYIITNVVS